MAGLKQTIKFCTAADGVRIAYALIGTGRPVVYVCGWPEHLEREWAEPYAREFLSTLARGCTLVRYDMRGSGLSDRDVDDLSLDALGRDLEAVVEATGETQCLLLSLGMLGGPISLSFTAAHPGRVERLALLGGYTQGSDLMPAQRRAQFVEYTREFGFPHFGFVDDAGVDLQAHRGVQDVQAAGAEPAVQARLLETFFAADLADTLPRVQVPTLVLHARDDRMIPFDCGRRLAADLPNASFQTLDAASSAPWAFASALVPSIESFFGLEARASDTASMLRGRYEPIERVGSQAWKAIDHQHGRHVALTVTRHARLLLSLPPHRTLPLVREHFADGDRDVVVADWVEGTDLGRLLRERGQPGLPFGLVLDYLAQAADALDHMHAHVPPIVHGDVRPEHLVLTPGGAVGLVGLGSASEHSSPADDVFGLAATALLLLTGSALADPGEIESLAPGEAQSIGRAIHRGLSPDPALRPRRASELVEQLRVWRESDLPAGVVTFLLTDIEGSTALWEEHGAHMGEAVARHESLVADCVESAGGRFIKSRGEGDATLSVFARATDAVRAAIAVQRVLAAERWPADIDLRVRIALHTGEAELRGRDYFGPTVNRAARIRSLARGGQVLLSQSTAQVVSDHLPADAELEDAGSHVLRGMARPERVSELRHPDVRVHAPRRADPAARALPDAVASLLPDAFVARSDALERLRHELDATASSGLRVVVVTGEAGVGKTSLAGAFARDANRSGAAVLYGRCDEDSLVPYQPFAEATAAWAALTDGVATTVHDPETARFRLFEAVRSSIAAEAEQSPVVLVVDDLQWADPATSALLRHVLRHAAGLPLLVVALLRTRDPATPAKLADIRRDVRVTDIELAGLETAELSVLLRALTHEEADTEFARALHDSTGGHPLFAREVIAHLRESGSALRADELSRAKVPRGVLDVISRRLDRMGADVSKTLRAASVAGPAFDLDVVAHAAGLSADSALDHLDAAVEGGLVVESAAGPGRYVFAHALVQQAVYETLTATRRASVHEALASAIETMRPDALSEHAAALSRHAIAARSPRAYAFTVAAGAEAMRRLAYEDAASHYARALELDDGSDATRRCELQLALGDAEWAAGRYAEGIELCRAAGRAAVQLRRADLVARAGIALGGRMTGFNPGALDADLIEFLEHALRELPPSEIGLRARARARLLEERLLAATSTAGAQGDDLRALREGAEEARATLDPDVVAYAVLRIGACLPDPDERLAFLAEARAASETAGRRDLARDARAWSVSTLLDLGKFERGFREMEDSCAEAEQLSDAYARAVGHIFRGMRAHMEGRLDEAEEHGRRVLDEAQGVPSAYGAATNQLLAIRWEQDRLAELESPGGFAVALACAETDRGEQASALVRPLVDQLRTMDVHSFGWVPNACMAAEVAALASDEQLAAQLHAMLEQYESRYAILHFSFTLGSVARFLGALDAVLGRLDDAVAHLDRAIHVEGTAGAALWLAHARTQLADVLLRRGGRGDAERASGLLREANKAADALGLVRLSRRAEALR